MSITKNKIKRKKKNILSLLKVKIKREALMNIMETEE